MTFFNRPKITIASKLDGMNSQDIYQNVKSLLIFPGQNSGSSCIGKKLPCINLRYSAKFCLFNFPN